jgi:xylulokinase
MADIFSKELVRTENPDTTALGSAILAAAGVKYFKSVPEACSRMVRTKEVFRPNKKESKVYNQAYQIFQKLYPASAPFFDSVAKIGL